MNLFRFLVVAINALLPLLTNSTSRAQQLNETEIDTFLFQNSVAVVPLPVFADYRQKKDYYWKHELRKAVRLDEYDKEELQSCEAKIAERFPKLERIYVEGGNDYGTPDRPAFA